ncbi:unnamed protein product [Orchesella dallaii]|uniref:Uncharacterized protein n=1 Tax=Orchesella dallaii TaxID=48710 RepID=A0ABP1QXL7_9HEXA
MIIQRVVKVQVLLLSLILLTQSAFAASKNKSSKSSSSKAKSSSTSKVQRHTSAHQYGPGEKVLFLKPSKPDPHFEITAEQRGIYFPTKIREGRGSSLEQKARTPPEKHRNAAAITFPSQTQSKRSSKKGKAKSSSSRAVSSTNIATERRIEHQQSKPRFSGSQLISGDVGLQAHKPQGASVEKNGWKILMGPSVAPDESIQETSSNEHRTFTSFTDGAQRTIVDLKKLRGKSKSSSISSYESFARNIKSVNHHSKIDSNFGPTRRSMQVSIPKQKLKHKYATITKRVPSKSNSERESTRYGKKVRMSFSNAKLPRHSASSKDHSQYFRPSSTESGLNVMSDSPVMTLDTKKLVIEPTFSSAEPTSMMSTTENFSSEHDDPNGPTTASVNSRYDRLPLNHRDIITSDDNDFHTKTAFGAADYPLLSVSATMNNPSERLNYNDNHHDEQTGDSDIAATNPHVEFLSFPDINHHQSHEIQEPQLQNGLIEDDNITPPPPPPEFLAATGNAFPSETHGVGRFPPSKNGKPYQFPPFHRVPIPIPYFAEQNFPLKVLPSEDPINIATPSDHPPISSSSRHPPLQLENSPPPPPPPHFHGPPGHLGLVHHGPRHHGPAHLGPGHHGPGHHGPLASIHHHPLPPPPPPPPHLAMEGGRPPPLLNPLDIGSGRHIPGQGPPPPPGVDPDHPAVQHALRHPYTVLKEPSSLEPPDSSAVAESNKNYLHYSVHKNALIPLDKRLVYLAMIFSWMFWISAFYSYYRWSAKGNKNQQILLNVPKNGETPEVSTRALDLGSQWNFTKVLEYIEIAQKTYEGFDWQDLNCQKRTLCELVQKQNEPWGETGRKMANSYVYRVMDALDGVPIPKVIQTYLKEYKEAISQGKNSSKDCGQVYAGCKFSIKDVLAKSAAKKKA